MGSALSQYTVGRDNNFNLIRFAAATLVLYSHSFPFSGHSDNEPLYGLLGLSVGSVAVDVFFLTSGFLIARSFFERKSLLAFAWARILRIYPALIIAVLFCALIIGPLFTTHPIVSYLTDPQTHEFIRTNSYLLSGVEYDLPGVFADNWQGSVVNGSLWTLPYEVKMYARLAVIGLILLYAERHFGRDLLKIVFLSIALVSIALNILYQVQSDTSEHFVRFSATFFAGAACYLYRARIILSWKVFLSLAILLALSAVQRDAFLIVYNLSLPYLILWLAYIPTGPIRTFNQLGDYSYGIYIYAAPIQQSVVAMSPQISVYALTCVAFCITLLLALASWHGVEKRCLSIKGHYVVLEKMLRSLRVTVATALTKG